MKRYRGNEKVEPGVYVNLRQISFKSVEEEGRLPGSPNDVYRRVPTLALLVAAPLLGGVYVIFLPLVGFGIVAWVLMSKAAALAAHAAVAASRVLKPAWYPAQAFLSRGRAAGKRKGRKDRWAEDVKKKLDERGDKRA